MKNVIWLPLAGVIYASVCMVAMNITSCTPQQREAVKTALDVADALCLIANQIRPDEEALKVCNVLPKFQDEGRKVLAHSRAVTEQEVRNIALARGVGKPCGSLADGGTK